jgi:hypothetical protein
MESDYGWMLPALGALNDPGGCPRVRRRESWDDRGVGRTVFIVDDHAPFRRAARELLTGEGYEVVGEAAALQRRCALSPAQDVVRDGAVDERERSPERPVGQHRVEDAAALSEAGGADGGGEARAHRACGQAEPAFAGVSAGVSTTAPAPRTVADALRLTASGLLPRSVLSVIWPDCTRSPPAIASAWPASEVAVTCCRGRGCAAYGRRVVQRRRRRG